MFYTRDQKEWAEGFHLVKHVFPSVLTNNCLVRKSTDITRSSCESFGLWFSVLWPLVVKRRLERHVGWWRQTKTRVKLPTKSIIWMNDINSYFGKSDWGSWLLVIGHICQCQCRSCASTQFFRRHCATKCRRSYFHFDARQAGDIKKVVGTGRVLTNLPSVIHHCLGVGALCWFRCQRVVVTYVLRNCG